MRRAGLLIILIGIASLACGPSQEELSQRQFEQQKRREDSLAAARKEIMRQDSLMQLAQIAAFKTEQKKKAELEKELNKPVVEQFDFGKEGYFCVQVESGTIPENLTRALHKWKNEGFNNAYISIKHGTYTQETWYRLRLGKFKTQAEAKQASKAVNQRYKVKSWVDNTKDEVEQ